MGIGDMVMPDCWRKIGEGSVYVNNNSTCYSDNSLYMIAGSAAEAYAVLPELDATLNELQLNFFGRFSNLNYSLEVGVMSDPYDPSTFEHVETVQARTTVWNEFHVPLTSYQGTGKFIALHSVSTGTTLYIDNLSVTYAPGCVRPSNLVVHELTTTTAKLDWRPGNTENSWQLVYGPMGFNPSVSSGAVSIITTEDSLFLTNLTPATYYDAYVRSVCDTLERSEWSQKCSFRTDCEPINTLPFEEDFMDAADDQWTEVSGITDTFYTVNGLSDNHQYLFKVKVVCSAGESAYSFTETFYTLCSDPLEIPYYENFDFMQDLSYMDCWTRPSAYVSTITLPSVHQQGNHAHSGTNSMRFGNDYCWMASPAINADIETLTLSFWASRHNSAGGTLDVGVMSNPCDTTTFELVRSVQLPAGNTFTARYGARCFDREA